MPSLNWLGDEVKRQVIENASKAMGEFGLTVEGESKKELRKGHGVETGTLRRSIHTAQAGYDWGSDDVVADKSSPELGNRQVNAVESSDQITVEVGSGLNYALPVHQGHHGFQGYHFLTNGLKKAEGKLQSILAKYKVQR